MQDGQNCFDRATSAFGTEWQIDETLTKLIKDNRIPPIIVVGVDNGLANRIKEYTYSADSERGGGYAAAYASYLLTEVKPFVDKSYRTKTDRAHTLIGGSSLGGLISLDIALRHPNTFAGVIAMSPALRWSGEAFTKELEQEPGGLFGTRVWVDMGTSESYSTSSEATKVQNEKLIGAAKRLDAALTKHRIAHRLVIDEQHSTHNETAWASRFRKPSCTLLGNNHPMCPVAGSPYFRLGAGNRSIPEWSGRTRKRIARMPLLRASWAACPPVAR